MAQTLRLASLTVSGVLPVAQAPVVLGSGSAFGARGLLAAAFVVHGLCWSATLWAVLRSGREGAPAAWPPAATWAGLCLLLAGTTAVGDAAGERVVVNASIGAGIALALAVSPRRAVAVAAGVAAVAGLLMLPGLRPGAPADTAAWYIALVTPVYTVCSALATGLIANALREVAGATDRRYGEPEPGALDLGALDGGPHVRSARVLHDTVINTLAAVGSATVVSSPDVIRTRCRADLRALDDLERRQLPAGLPFTGAAALPGTVDVPVTVDAGDLDALLRRQPGWRREAILGLLREVVINAAKHSGATGVQVMSPAEPARIIVRDDGVGMADTARVRRGLARRARDGMLEVTVDSAPDRGTTVTVLIPPLQTVDGQTEVTRAAASTAVRLVPVMLAEFVLVAVIGTALITGWSPAVVAPAATVLVIVGAVLTMLARTGTRRPVLPAGLLVATYAAMAAAGVVVVCAIRGGADGNLAWSADAAATICIVVVLVDGRFAVVLPPLLIGAVTAVVTTVVDGRPTGALLVVLFSEVVLVTVVVLIRRRLSAAAAVIEEGHHRDLARRDEIDLATTGRSGSGGAMGFAGPARVLLRAIERDPDLVRDPSTQIAARVEECCLRAVLVTAGSGTAWWEAVIAAARRARVLLDVHVFSGAPVAPESAGEAVVAAVVECRAGERVAVTCFAGEPLIVVAAESLPSGLREVRW